MTDKVSCCSVTWSESLGLLKTGELAFQCCSSEGSVIDASTLQIRPCNVTNTGCGILVFFVYVACKHVSINLALQML